MITQLVGQPDLRRPVVVPSVFCLRMEKGYSVLGYFQCCRNVLVLSQQLVIAGSTNNPAQRQQMKSETRCGKLERV